MHFYSPECYTCIGTDRRQEDTYCKDCKEQYDYRVSDKRLNFFVYIPIEPQIRSLLSNNKLYDILTNRDVESLINEDNIKDITSSKLYKEMVINRQFSGNDLSILWNTDGIAVFNSSNYSIWPLQATINELLPHLRTANMLLIGLWFSSTPCMNTFLWPFAAECKKLEKEGFHLSNEERPRKVLCNVS